MLDPKIFDLKEKNKSGSGTSSCPSSPLILRIQAIEDGKRVLMELIQSMPESSYELPLRDIIDDQQILKEETQKETIKEENLDMAENQHYLPRTKICNSTRVQSSANRTNSMQSRVLKLKMFIPEVLFLFNKKKPKIGNSSRILLRPFFNGNAKPIPTTKEDCKNRKTCSGKRDKKKSRSTVDEGTVSNPARVLESKFPYCWQLFPRRKLKLKETNEETFEGKQHLNTKYRGDSHQDHTCKTPAWSGYFEAS